MNNFFTTNEAAVHLGVTPSRIRQLILEGRLRSEKLGRDHLIGKLDLMLFEKNEKRKRGRPKKSAN